MNRRSALAVSLLLAAGIVAFLLFFRAAPAPHVVWELQLPEGAYVSCLAISEGRERPILVAGVHPNSYGSGDYDNNIVCFHLATGEELWRRKESEAGNLRGGKRPSTIEFSPSGDLIVGWDYIAVKERQYEVVSKLSAKDGALIWDWTAASEGNRPLGTGYKHGAWIFCEGSDILVKTLRSVGNVGSRSDMQEFYSVIDSSTGKPIAGSAISASSPEARWRAKTNSLTYKAADGNGVTWGRHSYEHTETNWLKWHREDGLWMPHSHWERRERVEVTRTPPHKSGLRNSS